MSNVKTSTMDGNEMILRDIGNRMRAGVPLTRLDITMALVAAGAVSADRFGPRPGDMQLKPQEVPESIKGILAQYSS